MPAQEEESVRQWLKSMVQSSHTNPGPTPAQGLEGNPTGSEVKKVVKRAARGATKKGA